jgi:uncharacterized phage protein gp47/JayE
MQLNLQTFTSMVQNSAASAQSACAQLLDFTVGSVLRALMEANAALGTWMQYLILLVLQTTRLATSTGTDCDTFVADFGLTRSPPTYATGTVVFSRFTSTTAASIAPGVQVKTLDGTQVFTVIADSTQTDWNATLGVYQLAAGAASGNATVQAVNVGSQGNVLAGTIGLLATAVPYIDTVTNLVPFTNGIDPQTDDALRSTFQNYIQTRSRATYDAIVYAVQSTQAGLTQYIQENTDASGNYAPGSFTVTINDGSGAPPQSLLQAVSASIAAYRPVGSSWAVQAPPINLVSVSLTITTNPTGNKPALLTPVQNAILAYIADLGIGATLSYTRIAAIVFGVDPSITDVTAFLLNGAIGDVSPTAMNGLIVTNAASVTIT